MRSNHMSKPRSKRSMYARLRSIDDRRVCCSQRECDRVGASISDAVGGSFALGYAFAVLSFSAPVYGCARPAAKGINKLPQMMAAAAGTGELCLPRVYESSEGNGSLSFELSLFNAIILDTLDTPVCGYSRMRDTVIFSVSHPYTWVRPMARWLDGLIAGSTARSMWLDGSMLTEDVFSLDALMPDSMPILMPSSMLA
jgi:hypothetical protein